MRRGAAIGVLGGLMLAGCSMDLDALRRADDVDPAKNPDVAGAGARAADSTAAGAGDSAGTGTRTGESGVAGSAVAGSMSAAGGGGGAPVDSKPASGNPPRTCGLPGLACCAGNLCDIGECLRGKCTPYGGFYAHSEACSAEPCTSRNAYTAGCACPMGFADTLLYTSQTTCDDGILAASEVRSCTSGRTPGIAFAGVWVEGPDDRCTKRCLTPNPLTGACNCPAGSQSIALNADTGDSGCPNASMMLQLCIEANGEPINFGGAYAVSQTAALGCSAPNPLTAACSCPDAVGKPQSLHVGNWSIFVCNL